MNKNIPEPITLDEIKYLADMLRNQTRFRVWGLMPQFAWWLIYTAIDPKEPPLRKMYNYSNFERLLKQELPKDHSLRRFWKP